MLLPSDAQLQPSHTRIAQRGIHRQGNRRSMVVKFTQRTLRSSFVGSEILNQIWPCLINVVPLESTGLRQEGVQFLDALRFLHHLLDLFSRFLCCFQNRLNLDGLSTPIDVLILGAIHVTPLHQFISGSV